MFDEYDRHCIVPVTQSRIDVSSKNGSTAKRLIPIAFCFVATVLVQFSQAALRSSRRGERRRRKIRIENSCLSFKSQTVPKVRNRRAKPPVEIHVAS